MQIDAANIKVVHNSKQNRFEIQVGKDVSVLEYDLRGQTIYFTHTFVPPALEGQGLANRMAETALNHARENSLKVVPACEFIHVYLRRHPQYQDLVRKLQ